MLRADYVEQRELEVDGRRVEEASVVAAMLDGQILAVSVSAENAEYLVEFPLAGFADLYRAHDIETCAEQVDEQA